MFRDRMFMAVHRRDIPIEVMKLSSMVVQIRGLLSQIARYPNDNLAIVVLSNDGDGTLLAEAVKWRITDEVFGLPLIDWDTRYRKQIEEQHRARQNSATIRPLNARLPSAPLESLEKTFSHLAYGTLHPCYVRKTHAPSSYCSTVLDSPAVKVILANSEPDVPTFITPFKHDITTYMRLTHFDRNIFNATVLWTNIDDRQAEGYGSEGGVLLGLDFNFKAEWVNQGKTGEGIAFSGGFWGMGAGGRTPEGEGEASAEVWFALV
ncbi:hypothetical protein AMATHDRAFT_49150 [Amanita thiersii Skay4041]|uniref:Uncharacterized protein n=1 Tax=Amanita thiersii Skay4041 TaxID=703135 RepID=A0A2A9NFR6_9AGAR|nr:hypothetical protein AMATHDRAFT_49150 [Amanita thiersii Skay4041]